MKKTEYNLYDFLAWCAGNWRNAIHIYCSPCRERDCPNQCRGCLLCADRDGIPKVVTVTRYEDTTGQKVEPSECLASISLSAFEAAYFSHLLWEVDDPLRCSLLRLEDRFLVKQEGFPKRIGPKGEVKPR